MREEGQETRQGGKDRTEHAQITYRSRGEMGNCWTVLTRGGCDLTYVLTDLGVENIRLGDGCGNLKP